MSKFLSYLFLVGLVSALVVCNVHSILYGDEVEQFLANLCSGMAGVTVVLILAVKAIQTISKK